MNQREKVLAGCLVGAVVIAGGYTVVKSRVYQPGLRLKADIKDEIARRDELQVRLQGIDKTVGAWTGQTGRTLGVEWFAAQRTFREDVEVLLRRNGLTEGLTTSPLGESRDSKGPREGFVELPLSVGVKGRLADLVNFLRDYYQRPYLVRVDKLYLSAEMGRATSKKRTGPRPEPKLTIKMTLSTLVLPEVENVDHPTINLAAVDDPDSGVEFVSSVRLREEDPVAYNEIAQVNFFKIYEPPAPVVRKAVEREPVETKPVEKEPVVQVDPRRDAHKFVLSGVGQLAEGPVAYVINTDKSTEPPTEYRLNDQVDGGKLVLVVPEGMVVRVLPAGKEPRTSPKNYFYPLGTTFKNREEVNPSEHPDITRVLRLVLKR